MERSRVTGFYSSSIRIFCLVLKNNCQAGSSLLRRPSDTGARTFKYAHSMVNVCHSSDFHHELNIQ
jgi:hypothetical protein